jgi:16S rRNA (uracil1498-N3)-methyltransferase
MRNNYISNIELYYTPPEFVSKSDLVLRAEEINHAIKVMRNSVDDDLYVTDGEGSIYLSKISSIKTDSLNAQIIKTYKYIDKSRDLVFCIPKIKNPERLKFAIEKCVELGITRFKIFESKHTVSKTFNLKRLQKIAIAAMKQSIRSFLPQIEFDTFDKIKKSDGDKIIFDQNSKNDFNSDTKFLKPTYYIFGPEGGLDNSELISVDTAKIFNLAKNRLRTETAVVKCASLLNLS